MKNGEVRYNCSILDLYDRSIIASITDCHITSELAIRTLQKALDSQPMRKGELLLHSDQGTQYTSKAFVEYCESVHSDRVIAVYDGRDKGGTVATIRMVHAQRKELREVPVGTVRR